MGAKTVLGEKSTVAFPRKGGAKSDALNTTTGLAAAQEALGTYAKKHAFLIFLSGRTPEGIKPGEYPGRFFEVFHSDKLNTKAILFRTETTNREFYIINKSGKFFAVPLNEQAGLASTAFEVHLSKPTGTGGQSKRDYNSSGGYRKASGY